MPKFVTKNINSVKGKQVFRQLVIVPDSTDTVALQTKIDRQEINKEDVTVLGQLDLYEESLETKYASSFLSILAIMNRVANLQGVSNDKFKDVTPDRKSVTEYEFKHGDLRVFAIKAPNGQLILLGGYKNQQSSDFKRFRSLKKQYLDFLNETK